MNTLASSFLIGSSSYLQETRTTKTSRTSSKFGQVRPRTAELPAIECLGNPHRLIMGKCCDHSSFFIFDSITFILAVTRICIKALIHDHSAVKQILVKKDHDKIGLFSLFDVSGGDLS